MKWICRSIVVTVLAVSCVGCVTQTEMAGWNRRLANLEQQYTSLRQESLNQVQIERAIDDKLNAYEEDLARKAQGTVLTTAQLREQLNSLRVDMQRMNGKIEEAQYALDQKVGGTRSSTLQMQKQIDHVAERQDIIDNRLGKVEQFLNIDTAAEGGKVKKSKKAQTETISDDLLYARGKKAFDDKEYERARETLKKLLKLYPDSKHADNAQFWIGETYYNEKWYEKAILEYQKVIENFPDGNKVKAALLKQGFAFDNLGDKSNAKLILKQLVKKFPDSQEAKIAAKKIESM